MSRDSVRESVRNDKRPANSMDSLVWDWIIWRPNEGSRRNAMTAHSQVDPLLSGSAVAADGRLATRSDHPANYICVPRSV